jgi:hypothetical protein
VFIDALNKRKMLNNENYYNCALYEEAIKKGGKLLK